MYNCFDIKCKVKNIFVNVHYIDIVHTIIVNLSRWHLKKNKMTRGIVFYPDECFSKSSPAGQPLHTSIGL